MSSLTASSSETSSGPRIKLLKHQFAELFDYAHFLIFHCGGRGSGKSKINHLHYFIRSERCVDLPYGLFAATDTQVQTFLSLLRTALDEIGVRYVYGTRIPKAWRKRWRRRGIIVPPRRFRTVKMLITEDGLHVIATSLVNNAFARVKSMDLMFALFEEATDPNVTKEALETIIGCVRCGVGEVECRRRRHYHGVVVKFNVPLNDPSHFVYKMNERYAEQEKERAAKKLQPFYRLIESGTKDNPHTGTYVDRLAAAWDARTYEEQTTGKLERRSASTTYHAFSANNILGMKEKNTAGPGLYYDPHAPLHVWFDFNTTPAVAGWGHDLRLDDVPPSDIRAGHEYFGVIGELFSDNDPMHTDQVAKALLEDPTAKTPLDGRCVESGCGHPIAKHMNMGARGFLCSVCEWKPEPGSKMFCSGQPIGYEFSRKYIHAPPNWRGLVKHRGKIFIYADPSGEQEHAAAVKGPSLQILRDMFGKAIPSEWLSWRTKKAHPRIVHREAAVNRSLCSQAKIHTLFIGAWCSAHIADLREVVPDPKTGTAKKVQWTEAAKKKGDEYPKRGHLLDALGYMVDYRWPFLMPKSGGLPAMAEASDFGPLETDWPRV